MKATETGTDHSFKAVGTDRKKDTRGEGGMMAKVFCNIIFVCFFL